MNQRIPLGTYHPYDSEQFKALRVAFMALPFRDGLQASPDELFDKYWPGICREARECQKRLAIHAAQSAKVTKDKNPFRKFRNAALNRKWKYFVEDNPDDLGLLFYGAFKAGVLNDKFRDDEALIDALQRLSDAELNASVSAVTNEGSVLVKEKGRPHGLERQFTRFLIVTYREITSRESHGYLDETTGERDGPAIRFFSAAYRPFPKGVKSHGIEARIRRMLKEINGGVL